MTVISGTDDIVSAYPKRLREQLVAAQHRMRLSPSKKLFTLPGKLFRTRMTRWTGPMRVVAEVISGDRMNVIIPEPVSTTLYCYGHFDPSVCHMMLDRIQSGDVVFDVGSHFGFFTLFGAALAGEKGSVHCFEPTPSTFEMAKGNTVRHLNIRCNNCAVADTAGKLPFRDFGVEHSAFNSLGNPRSDDLPPFKEVSVDVIRLDDYCLANGLRPNFVKIDAENAEFQVLKGMEQTLRKSERISVAVEVSQETFPKVRELLLSCGLIMKLYNHDGPCPISDQSDNAAQFKDVLFVKHRPA